MMKDGLMSVGKSYHPMAYAMRFAAAAHGSQVRKYTGQPYMDHPVEVAELVASVLPDMEVLMGALMHDVAEDTHVTLLQIKREFGYRPYLIVREMTDLATLPYLGNRKARKSFEAFRLLGVSPEAQTVKVADLISNARSIKEFDHGFYKVFSQEAIRLYFLLDRADPALRRKLQNILF